MKLLNIWLCVWKENHLLLKLVFWWRKCVWKRLHIEQRHKFSTFFVQWWNLFWKSLQLNLVSFALVVPDTTRSILSIYGFNLRPSTFFWMNLTSISGPKLVSRLMCIGTHLPLTVKYQHLLPHNVNENILPKLKIQDNGCLWFIEWKKG